jgi:hypothetical protein
MTPDLEKGYFVLKRGVFVENRKMGTWLSHEIHIFISYHDSEP